MPVLAAEVYERGRKAAEFPPAAGPAATPLALSQDRTERLLVEGLADRGHALEWNTELLSWDGAAAVLRGPDGAEERLAVRWPVEAGRLRLFGAIPPGMTVSQDAYAR
ncbi:hypothetical protein [Nonomuraea turkmeniaca]|uniref:hypothetical protein n=1 Tax=Nonomuraea turkmeniaca TaxID=103838 RepID=UPI001476F8C0|nr:hypothetical protein [Nonomuraea turkmeniaca]